MDVLIKPRLEEEKRKNIQQTKEEATENAITTVKQKIKEQMEAEQVAREAEGKCHHHILIVLHINTEKCRGDVTFFSKTCFIS